MKVFWTYENRDSVTVTGAASPSEAWDAAETFLAEVSEADETTEYSTGLSGSEWIEDNQEGIYTFRVVSQDK